MLTDTDADANSLSEAGHLTDAGHPASTARAALIDLDGTVHARGALLPGSTEAIAQLRAQGVRLRFLTNTDSKPPAAILAELTALGLDITADELFTPVAAARLMLATAGASALLVVSAAVRPALAEFAGDPTSTGDATPTHVVVGDCRDVLNYRLLDSAFRAVRAGAELVALQRGRYFKRADGDHLDTGAVVAALEYATDTRARLVGKPSPDFFGLAVRSVGCAPERCVVVGDDATTDVAGGRAIGARTVQVRTGKYADQQDQQAQDGLPQADDVIDSLANLPDLLATWEAG
ncbi:HAD-superfamily subfamily IIA hydrolase like protein [Actinobacteria bacterium OK074]|nr:HAD-superfamily subfamily IIA hydrolase like protein [Actinobacteria bacterium OK074]